MVGFGIGLVLLALTTLIAIPTMIKVSGPNAWAAIATGQAIGTVGAVIVSYGWVVNGPASISRATTSLRRREYIESLRTRLILFVPVGTVCAVVAALVAQHDHGMAALGAASTAAMGLTASWFFVGTSQPYMLLFLEFVPRAVGTFVGIGLMRHFETASIGIVSQLGGVLLGLLVCSWFILRHSVLASGSGAPLRSFWTVMSLQRHGVALSAVATGYAALPITIVGLVLPTALPVFAILDKLQKQLGAGLSPVNQVLQGWVPRAAEGELLKRAKTAIVSTIGAGIVVIIILAGLGRYLFDYLGGRAIAVSTISIALMAVAVSLGMLELVISRACLVPLGLIRVVVKVTLWGSAVGLVCAAVGLKLWGINGVFCGLIAGATFRIGLQLRVLFAEAQQERSPFQTAALSGIGLHAASDH